MSTPFLTVTVHIRTITAPRLKQSPQQMVALWFLIYVLTEREVRAIFKVHLTCMVLWPCITYAAYQKYMKS